MKTSKHVVITTPYRCVCDMCLWQRMSKRVGNVDPYTPCTETRKTVVEFWLPEGRKQQ